MTSWAPRCQICKPVAQCFLLDPHLACHSPLYHPITEITKKNSHSEHHRLLLLIHCCLIIKDIRYGFCWFISQDHDQDEPSTPALYVVFTQLIDFRKLIIMYLSLTTWVTSNCIYLLFKPKLNIHSFNALFCSQPTHDGNICLFSS